MLYIDIVVVSFQSIFKVFYQQKERVVVAEEANSANSIYEKWFNYWEAFFSCYSIHHTLSFSLLVILVIWIIEWKIVMKLLFYTYKFFMPPTFYSFKRIYESSITTCNPLHLVHHRICKSFSLLRWLYRVVVVQSSCPFDKWICFFSKFYMKETVDFHDPLRQFESILQKDFPFNMFIHRPPSVNSSLLLLPSIFHFSCFLLSSQA